MALDQQSRRTAARVIDGHARLGVEDDRHEDGHLAGSVELARALALVLGELPQQVLVGPADHVGLHVVQAESVIGVVQDPHQTASRPSSTIRCPAVVTLKSVTLITPGEPGVLPGDRPDRVRQELAQAG